MKVRICSSCERVIVQTAMKGFTLGKRVVSFMGSILFYAQPFLRVNIRLSFPLYAARMGPFKQFLLDLVQVMSLLTALYRCC